MCKAFARIAQLHRKGKSPTGKYGFPCTTLQVNLPQDNTWTDTWKEFYANGMRRMLHVLCKRFSLGFYRHD